MILLCLKQHLSNISSSIHGKVKQHWGWVEKKALLMQKHVLYNTINKRSKYKEVKYFYSHFKYF